MRKLLIPIPCLLLMTVVLLTALTDGVNFLFLKLHNWILNDNETKM